ncbi:hypothetical protein COCOBI_19-1600 [Coccomyxa sp. Obi]|nr:hypothetical protein COCOBI_19-1600 [Coccomyxa sp. Obi]
MQREVSIAGLPRSIQEREAQCPHEQEQRSSSSSSAQEKRLSREMVWRPCRRVLLAAAVLALHSVFVPEAAAERQSEPAVRLEEEAGQLGDYSRRIPLRRLQQAASDVTQVQTRAKNTIDGQLNLPDPSTGPKPEVLAQQAATKIAQAVPTVGPKLVNLTNAIYQNADLAPVMSRLLSLAQNNIVGAFPGANPYGFQADPNTFCLFAVPKNGGAADPASQLNSWLAKNPLDSLGSSLQQSGLPGQSGSLPALPAGNLNWAARQPISGPDAGVIGLQKDGKTYACTPYQPFGGGAAPLAYGASAQSPLQPALPDTSPLFPSDGTTPVRAAAAGALPAPAAAPSKLMSPEDFTRQYLDADGTPKLPAPPAAAPNLAADIFADFADDAFYGQAPAPGGYGSAGVKRPPIAYYNAATGGVVVTPPKSLFTSFSKSLDTVMQGKSGNPFFDCVTMNSDLPPFKSFVQANGNNAQTLANHFVSYLKGGLSTPDGGLADKITFENPFDPNSKPINLKFNAERPYFNLPQGGLPYLAQPQAGGLGGPTTLQQGPPLLPPNALANPAASAASGLAAPVDTSATPTFTSVVFDGYLSDCTVIIGSYPHGDGTFDKANDFQSVVVDGAWNMALATAKLHAGQVAYIVPAAKGNGYPALDGANNRPGFCFDTALLLPEFNPMAVPLPDSSWNGNGGLVASPLSTVLVFAASSGLTKAQLQAAFGIDNSIDISTFNALADALNKGASGPGLAVLKADVKVQNTVTLGATALNNNSAAYASYAILIDQAIGQQIVKSAAAAASSQASAAAGRHLLQAAPTPVDLSKTGSVDSLMQFAMASAASNPDPSVRNSLSPGLTDQYLSAAATAAANLNALADAATNANDVEKTSYYAQAVLADQLQALRSGAMTPAQFAAATTPDALAAALAKTQLPGRVAAPGTGAAATLGSAPAAGSGGASGGGLSRTLVIVISVCSTLGGLLVITLVVLGLVALVRRHEADLPEQETSVAMSGASGGYWWRSPLWGRADSGSAPSGQTVAGSSSLKY